MKCPDFEVLSAYADGEVSAAEKREVESHLHSCPGCAGQLQSLGVVGEQLRRPLARPFQIKLQPPARGGWWQGLRDLAESPVVHLVGLQRRRRARYGAAEMFRMAALFAVPMLFMCMVEDRSALTAFLIFSALGLMVGLPLRQFSEEVALLASLQRGRCLDEIVSTGTSPRGVLDGLALQGLMQISKAALTVWPVLLLGTLALPPDWQIQAWELEFFWLPGLVALFLAGYYFAQFLQVFPGSGLKRLFLSLALLCPLILLYLGLAGGFLAALLIGLGARQLAILGLSNPERPRAVPLQKRNPLVRSVSQNPIARRELGRLAGQMGGNWMRLAVWRASMTVLPVAWALHAAAAPIYRWPEVLAGATLLFSGLFFVRAAQRTLPAVVREREQKSWEILMQTHIGTRMFVNGWMQVCLYTVFSEGLLALLAIGGYVLAIVPADCWLSAGLGLLILPGSAWLGAYLGLAISASSRDSRQASQSLVRWCLLALCAWLVILGLYGGGDRGGEVLGLGSLLTVLPVGLAVLALAARQLKLLSCIDPEESTQFEQATRYSPVVCSLDLASLAGLFYCVNAWKQLSPLLDATALQGASLLIAGALMWWFMLRMPLATIAEAALGGRINLLIGVFFGFGMGQALCLAWKIHSLTFGWMNSEMVPPTLLLGSLALGAIQGVIAAGMRPINDQRVRILTRRLGWAGASVLAVLALAAAAHQNKIPQARRLSVPPRHTRYGPQLFTLQHQLPNLHPSRSGNESPLPPFGHAAYNSIQNQFLSGLSRTQQALQGLAARQARRGDGMAALNTLRWCLLCCDSRPVFREDVFSEEMPSLREGESQILNELEKVLQRYEVPPDTAQGLMEQLLDQSSLQDELLALYTNQLVPLQPGEEASALPQLYLDRERAALALAGERAELKIQQLQLWELAHSDPAQTLLGDVRYCPLARRALKNEILTTRPRERLREATHREALALLVASKLYRQSHAGEWPADLATIQNLLPRSARCYLNPEGSFDYRPGALVGKSGPSEKDTQSYFLALGEVHPR